MVITMAEQARMAHASRLGQKLPVTCRTEEEAQYRHDPHVTVGRGEGQVQHYEGNPTILYGSLQRDCYNLLNVKLTKSLKSK